MGTIVVPEHLKSALGVFMGCPNCGKNVQDNRYKRKADGNPVHIYRASMTSLTLECKECRLRFCVTWNQFAKFLSKQFDNTVNNLPQDPDKRDFYLRWLAGLDKDIKFIDSTLDGSYSKRKPPGVI